MKFSAVAQRGAQKDFADIYALGMIHVSIQKMLAWYQQKYSVSNLAHLLYSLVYFDDADLERMPPMLWDMNWRTIKDTIRQCVNQLTRKGLLTGE